MNSIQANPSQPDIAQATYTLLLQVNERVLGIEESIEGLKKRMDSLEARMDSLEARMDSLEARMDSLEARMDSLEARMDSLETEVKVNRRLIIDFGKRLNSEIEFLATSIHENFYTKNEVDNLFSKWNVK